MRGMGSTFHQLCPRYRGTLTPTAPTAIRLYGKSLPLPRSTGLAKTILQFTVEGKEEVDRRRGGKTILKSGQECTISIQLGLLKTGQRRKGMLQIHLWCPNNLPRLKRLNR